MTKLVSLACFGVITAGAAVLGAATTRKAVDSRWYARLRKPAWQPPKQVFAPVWTALYGSIAASGARVWQAPRSPARTRALAWWGAQLALNTGWSVAFFGKRSPRAALAEIVVLLASIGAYAAAARKVDTRAAWMIAPYLGWTAFATLLNAEIVRRNP